MEAAELEQALARVMACGPVEVYEGGQLLPRLDGFRYEVRARGADTLLHLWSDDANLVRRVVGVAESAEGHLALDVMPFGRSNPARLEFLCPQRPRAAKRLSREKFRARFRQFLVERFPDDQVDSLTSSADREHSFSGCYTRGLMHCGRRAWAVIGVSGAESPVNIEAILSTGLLWLDWTRERAARRAVAGLRMVMPSGAGVRIAHRLRALRGSSSVELYELDEENWRARKLDSQDTGNLATWLTPWREVEQTLTAAGETIDRIRAMAPASSRGAIDAIVPPGTKEIAFRFRGLEFARWKNGLLEYGLPDQRRALAASNWKPLAQLLKKLELHRNPAADKVQHALYRAYPERWLETLVLADPARIDAHLDAKHLYSQVPAFSASDRGVMDLLGVTRAGRLVVIELKASEDIHLPLQAADYWLRVWSHHQRGEFPRYGYFHGVELQPKPPLLYLVAPGFQFHPANEVLLRHFSPQIEVTRIGLNEQWRRGIRVIFRQSRTQGP